ncbi:P-type conjugative transfer protein TrbG [Sphingomonas sp. BT-65]|uniref:P-type conjugative transfer protein TrbG n=1 Tax=Sphingomonas sp. BT-65 TaxID=2989821 RepID=UPI002235AE27|nr:P-type conjugative transfer protein TrbG [Sphingomonas sp. BT-65]MCW4460818.1 P-type conjugative transfer protein TrbG [Sphingomonas sp. BT-65]
MTRTAPILLLLLAGCAGQPRPAPAIALDDPPPAVPAESVPEPPRPVEVVAVPEPLPLPGQLKPRPGPALPETGDPKARIARAHAAARVEPAGDLYINATQVWPFAPGALYQLYLSPGHVTDIALEPGEQLVSVSAGDTVRWIVGDTTSGSGAAAQVHILVKPIAGGLSTNLVINSDRRTYHLELSSAPASWMASVSWSYPTDALLALRRDAARSAAAAPVAEGVALDRLNFRYRISGDDPAWRPLRAFDDGVHVYVQFPAGIAQGDMPPLFVIGPAGETELVNYRVRAPYYIVDRLFGAAELRLGGKRAETVRIERDDAKRRERRP